MKDHPPYTPNRELRAVAKWIKWQAVAEREPGNPLAAALAAYWGKRIK